MKNVISIKSKAEETTYNLVPASLALHIPSPPVPPLIRHLIPIDANLPSILPSHALPTHSKRDYLHTEAHSKDLYVLSGRRCRQNADEFDQRRDKRSISVLSSVL